MTNIKGFSDQVHKPQEIFSAILSALASPGQWVKIDLGEELKDAPLPRLIAALALTLLDQDTKVWLSADWREAQPWLAFHNGVKFTENPKKAAFALLNQADTANQLADFFLGTIRYPDQSTTIILAGVGSEKGKTFQAQGPGIQSQQEFTCSGLPNDFVQGWEENNSIFPLGVDLLLVDENQILGLPRTVKLKAADLGSDK